MIFVFTERPAPRPSKASPTCAFERHGLSDTDRRHRPQPGGVSHLHGVHVTDVLPSGGGTAISGVSNVAHVTGGGGAVANCGLVRLNEAKIYAIMMLINTDQTDQWDMFCVMYNIVQQLFFFGLI